MRWIVAVALTFVSLVPAAAHAKDDFALELCGRSGCKLVTDPVVAAALSQATDDFGVVAPAHVSSPFFTVRYVPPHGTPIGPTYRLSQQKIVWIQEGSEPRVSATYAQALAGVKPFGDARNTGVGWLLVLGVAIGFVAAVALVTSRWARRMGGSPGRAA